jgi:hypothetical protein
MVNQHADRNVIAQPRAQTCFSIEGRDPRSDDRRRMVEVARGSVTIRRAVAGVAMTIRVSADAYRGVALRIRALEGDQFHYEVRLVHRDPDLSVVLGEGDDLAAMDAQWREWVAYLGLPALAGRGETLDAPVNLSRAALPCLAPNPRRQGDALRSRRPRFRKRRLTAGVPVAAGAVDRDPVVLFFGWRDDC